MAIIFNGSDTIVSVNNHSAITSLDTFTYGIWAYRIGNGEGNLGRMIDKTGGTGSVLFKGAANTYRFSASRWPTTDGEWSIPQPGTNVWVHVAATYDYGSVLNDPLMYLDGVSQTVTETVTPNGTPLNADTGNVYIGNNNTSVRTWDGYLAHACIWNVILSPTEIATLAKGANPLSVRQHNLVFYAPLRHPLSLTEWKTKTWMIQGGTVAHAADPNVLPYAPTKPLTYARTAFVQAGGRTTRNTRSHRLGTYSGVRRIIPIQQ